MPERIPMSSMLSQEKSKEKFPNIDIGIARQLEKVDFEKLRNIFSKKISDLGLDPKINLINFASSGENFKNSGPIKGFLSSGSYDGNGVISLDINSFEEFKKSGLENPEDIQEQNEFDYILSMVTHEETHAVAKQEFIVKSHKISNYSATLQGGYASFNTSLKFLLLPKAEYIFLSFNEGVTELISREVLLEYMERREPEGRMAVNRPYQKAINVFNGICENICSECNIEKDVFWKVIQRGYFAGENLSGEKMERLFQNIFPEDFINKLKKMKRSPSENEAENIMFWLSRSIWTENDRKRVRRWILHVYNQMSFANAEK
jgi:hypothetical protein